MSDKQNQEFSTPKSVTTGEDLKDSQIHCLSCKKDKAITEFTLDQRKLPTPVSSVVSTVKA